MAYSILSDETKYCLEQARSRLMTDRAAIEALAIEAFDQTLQDLNALIGTDTTIEPKPAKRGANIDQTTEQAKGHKATKSEPPAPARSQSKPPRQQSQPFDPKQLQGDFKGMTTSAAITQIMQQDMTQTYAATDLIETLYGKLGASERLSATKSVSAVLMQGARSSKFEKVENNPSRYNLRQSTAVSA
jgi:hypothetical protein